MGRFGLGRSFWPIFRVSHFGLWLFWPKSESDNYMCMHYYMCMNGQMAGVKFCEKMRLKCKKSPFTTQAETTHVKMPQRGQNDLLPLQCDAGKSREFIEKTTQNIDFGTIQHNIF